MCTLLERFDEHDGDYSHCGSLLGLLAISFQTILFQVKVALFQKNVVKHQTVSQFSVSFLVST